MSQKFIQGKINHLTWVMVDATDFATPESAMSAATKIKIYGMLNGNSTAVFFVSSGTGSLTKDIQHVGASVLGCYTIPLATADLSDASAAFYDTYVVSLSATGAAYQTLIIPGERTDTSRISNTLSYLSDISSKLNSRVTKGVATNSQLSDLASDLRSYLVGMSGMLSDTYSNLSDFKSDFQSRVPKAAATASRLLLLESVASDAHSAAAQANSRALVLQSMISDVDSALTSQYTAGHPLTASDMSDIRSAIAGGPAATVTASDISDIASAVWANATRTLTSATAATITVSDISDIASAVWANATRTLTSAAAATITVSDISDIASRVQQVLASDLSDILSAAQQANSRVLVVQSIASDAHSAAIATQSTASDIYSLMTAGVALNASALSDVGSRVALVLASDLSDILSGVRATQSLASDAHSAAVRAMSDTSDIYSLLNAGVTIGASSLSDIRSAVLVGPTDVQLNASSLSDLRSAILVGPTDVQLNASSLSDIRSAITAAQSDINSNIDAGVTLAATEWDSMIDRNLAGGGKGNTRNLRNTLRAIRNKVLTDGTNSVVKIYEEDDTTVAWSGAISTAAGNPIVEVDPT